MALDPARVKSLFLAASVLPDPAQRAAYLERECGEQTELRARVEALLRAEQLSGEILDVTFDSALPGPAAALAVELAVTAEHSRHDAQPGAVIAGKYTLIEVIGEGGMGSVWRAKQMEPVKRFVAIKLIKAGMDSKSVLARFDAERQALALMDHPNIAKVFDGGLHQYRPFFVMELVKGVPITDFCDVHRLSLPKRLELIVPVCEAIQHAHQKGIIHRDIKPGNVLIALYDDKPVVKVIDFGVAKATGGTLTEQTFDTGMNAVVGTPQYMSPEQATFNNLDIDTRSDVYALGVLLYELLTGSTPFSKHELEKRGLLEMLRVVREEEPSRPSTKLSTADALPTLSANRSTDPKKLTGLLRNELDWIVMRALEKDRTRRYQTANGLARDIQRFLADEPVEACPPSLGYRLRKYVHKHRTGVFAAVAMALLLIAGTAVSTWQAYRARSAETKALQAAEAESNARQEEAVQRRLAEDNERAARELSARAVAERQVADAVRKFLQENLLRQANAQTQASSLAVLLGQAAIQENPTVRELLDRAMVELSGDLLETKFPAQPLVQAEILRSIGDSYRGTGDYERSAAVLERASQIAAKELAQATESSQVKLALGDMAELISLECDNSLGQTYGSLNRIEEAEKIFARLVEHSQLNLGPTHQRTLISRLNLADCLFVQEKFAAAATIIEDTLKLLQEHAEPADPLTLATMTQLAKVYISQGRTTEAVSLLENGLQLLPEFVPDDDPLRIRFLSELATAANHLRQHDRAIELLTKIYSVQASQHGLLHPVTLVTACNLAGALLDSGQVEAAITRLEQLQPDVERQLGRLHPNHLKMLHRLFVAYQTVGRADLAARVHDKFTIEEMLTLDLNQLSVLSVLNNLAAVEYSAGRIENGLKLLEKVREYTLKRHGPEHASTLVTLTNLASFYQALGRSPEALETLQPVAATLERKFGFADAKTLKANLNLAIILWKIGRKEEGLDLALRVVETSQRVMGELHLDTIDALEQLAEIKRERSELASAAIDLDQVCQVRKRVQGTDNKVTWKAVRSLARVCQDQGRWNDAIGHWEDLVAWQSVAEHRDTRQWLRDKFALAAAYKQADRPADAWSIVQQMLPEQRTLLGDDAPDTLATLSESGFLCWKLQKFDEAILNYREVLERNVRLKGESHADTILASVNLAVNQRDAGQLEAAQSTAATWLEHWRTALQNGQPNGPFAIQTALDIARRGGKLAEAEGLHRDLVAHWRLAGDTGADRLASELTALGANLSKQKKFAQAEKELADAFERRTQRLPDGWVTFNTQALLGAAILDQAQLLKQAADPRAVAEFERAEPFLNSGYIGMKTREPTIPPTALVRLNQTLERLIELYSALDKPDEVRKWQAELDQRLAAKADGGFQ